LVVAEAVRARSYFARIAGIAVDAIALAAIFEGTRISAQGSAVFAIAAHAGAFTPIDHVAISGEGSTGGASTVRAGFLDAGVGLPKHEKSTVGISIGDQLFTRCGIWQATIGPIETGAAFSRTRGRHS